MEVVECYENDCFPFSGKKTNSDTVYFYIKGFFRSAILLFILCLIQIKNKALNKFNFTIPSGLYPRSLTGVC